LKPFIPLPREQVEALVRESPEAVVNLVMVMQEKMAELTEQVGQLRQRVAELEAQNRPPSAPFRRREDERSASPKKPGRAPDHPGSYRRVPTQIDEQVEVPLACCPQCAGSLEKVQAVVQYLEEIVPARPHVTKLTTYEGHCPSCRQMVRSLHPLQTSTARGCAQVQLGVRALSLAAELKHGLGLSFAKTQQVLAKFGGLHVTRGGLALAFQRLSAKLAQEDAALCTQLRGAPVVHTDETSWWVNGPHSLWVFVVPGAEGLTLYRVVAHRDRQTFHEIIPPDYAGLLISDCLSVYDGATAHQHKCYSHHLVALREARLRQSPSLAELSGWFAQAAAFFRAAMELKDDAAQLELAEQQTLRGQLEVFADRLFANPRADPDEEAFRFRIAKQRDHLLSFLDHPSATATNNLAERQLRPAVIARKISCGQKTAKGATAWQTLASLAATCAQRSQDFTDFLRARLCLAVAG
jgi:hypothetical protein